MKFTNRGQAGLMVFERMDSQRLVSKFEIPEKFHDQLQMVNRGVRNGSHPGLENVIEPICHEWTFPYLPFG